MGIAILVIFSFGLYFVLRAMFRAVVGFFNKARAKAKAKTTVEVAQVETHSEVLFDALKNEPSWASFEIPAFVRRGFSYPALMKSSSKSADKMPGVQMVLDL